MSGEPSDDTTGQLRPEGDNSDEKVETANENEGDVMPSPQEEEAAIKKKYGGIVPRKPPLISKDHERAYFDSADWALGKQGGNPQKPKGPLEALRPKLQPTQQQARLRRFPYASADNEGTSYYKMPISGGAKGPPDRALARALAPPLVRARVAAAGGSSASATGGLREQPERVRAAAGGSGSSLSERRPAGLGSSTSGGGRQVAMAPSAACDVSTDFSLFLSISDGSSKHAGNCNSVSFAILQ